MTDVEIYIASFRDESPETIREAIDAVASVSWASEDLMMKGQRITEGLRKLLPVERQGSLF